MKYESHWTDGRSLIVQYRVAVWRCRVAVAYRASHTSHSHSLWPGLASSAIYNYYGYYEGLTLSLSHSTTQPGKNWFSDK